MAHGMTWQDFVEDAITAHLQQYDHSTEPHPDDDG